MRPDRGGQAAGQLAEPAMGADQQVQPCVLGQQAPGPAIPGARDPAQAAQRGRHPRRLGVHHAGGHLLAGPAAAGARQARPHLVAQPGLQPGQALSHPGPALLRA
ncbi:MAG TPA: hypothetical protein VFX25_08855, partial [Streptosporangiaceae bacterium]|nr:hypothetical protein [Streptosporangiaceae bacterium]